MHIMGYDYSSYKRQYDNNAAKYRAKETASQTDGLTPDNSSNEMVSANTPDKLNPNEFLSRMKRTDKFSPVITIVIYYGEEPWDGARSLHEMLNIPNEFKKYVNDYKMLLIEARNPDLIFHNSDNIDFFNLMGIILNKNLSHKEARQEAILYSDEHQTDKSVIMAIAGATNIEILQCVLYLMKLLKRARLKAGQKKLLKPVLNSPCPKRISYCGYRLS